MNGTPSQIEWAERIRVKAGEEFDRVARSFRSVSLHQNPGKRAETDAILTILEEKREAVMRRQDAGYSHSPLAGNQRPGSADDQPG